MKAEIKTKITNGKLSNLVQLQRVIDSFEGKEVVITIEKAKRKRSNPQNAYYWGVVVTSIKDGIYEHGTLITNEQTHEFLKSEFLTIDVPISDDGEFIEVTKGTSELDTFEFNEFIESCIRWGAEMLGIIIPYPNE